MSSPPSPPTGRDLEALLAVMAALRTPGSGCPWDLAQTFATIAPYTIEEACEVADAIQRNDLVDLKDELGDLLLQVVYHARMAEEIGAFAFADVVAAITDKMIRRHPHVFGSAEERRAGPSEGWWERIKAEERRLKDQARRTTAPAAGVATEESAASVLAGVPPTLPALTQAVKLQDKAARVGFDWPHLGPVFDKMREELDELAEVALTADPRRPETADAKPPTHSRERIAEEYGDLLFVMANVARHLKIDPEATLRSANAKFRRRFGRVEALLRERGKAPEQSTLEEMDGLWNDVKREERGEPSR
ncbi:MAG: nucleoside triphosphate pyrophosphohydrolase [Hyphomicrobiaceae bacterium]